MMQRLYINNFRCLENFEIKTNGLTSLLLLGKNGVGKSTVASALEILQTLARGKNRVRDLVTTKDFTRGRSDIPIRFEIEVLIDKRLYKYLLALELPESFKELRVLEEQLSVGEHIIYTRKQAQIKLMAAARSHEAQFLVDWHLIALPVIQEQSETDPLRVFKTWLARTIILAPIAPFMNGDSEGETLQPEREGANFADWFTGVLTRYPAAYTQIEDYLHDVMPDYRDFLNEPTSKETKTMVVRFQQSSAELSVPFKYLSDGEKCFFLCAVVLAANNFYGPLFCFWDEPDNYLSLSEVGHFVTSLRRGFGQCGQIIVTSHNPEAIRRFSDENTLFLDRKSHLEPTVVRRLGDVHLSGDLVDALIRGDVASDE